MQMAFKRPLPLRDEDIDLRERKPPRQHSPVQPEWKNDRPHSSSSRGKAETKKFSSSSRTFLKSENNAKCKTQKFYDDAVQLKKDFERSWKNLENFKKSGSKDMDKKMNFILEEVQKISLNFDWIFREVYMQQSEILSLIERT